MPILDEGRAGSSFERVSFDLLDCNISREGEEIERQFFHSSVFLLGIIHASFHSKKELLINFK